MTGISSRAYTAALQRKYARMLEGSAQAPAPQAPPYVPGATLTEPPKPSLLESMGSPTNPVGATIDVLSRPVYGVGRFVGETLESADRILGDGFQAGDIPRVAGEHIANQAQGLREMVFPERRELPSEAIYRNWDTKDAPGVVQGARFAAGLATDILLDPLTYVGAGAIRAGLKAIPGVSALGEKVTRGVRPLGPKQYEEIIPEAAKAADNVPKAETPVAPTESLVPEVKGPLQIEAPPARPPALLLEAGPIGKRTQAIRQAQEAEEAALRAGATADDISKGRFVYTAGKEGTELTPSQALVWAVDKSGTISREAARYRYLENTATGEMRMYNPRLLNLRRSQPKYKGVNPADLDLFAMKAADEAFVAPEDIVGALRSKNVLSRADATPISVDDFIRYIENKPQATHAMNRAGHKVDVTAQIKRYRAALASKNTVEANRALTQIKSIYNGYVEAFTKAKAEVVTKLEAERIARQIDRARPVRLTGDELKAAKARISELLDATDTKALLAVRQPGKYEEAVSQILSQRIKVPTYVERVVDSGATRPPSAILADELMNPTPVPPSIANAAPKTPSGKKAKATLEEAMVGVKPASETIEEAVPNISRNDIAQAAAAGTGLTEEAINALRIALGPQGQQWAGRALGFNWTTKVQKSARNSPTPGEGLAVNREAFNAMAQTNAFRSIVRQGSEQAAAQGLTGLRRSEWLASPNGYDLIGKIKSYERFLRLNGAEPILSKSVQGWPVGLGDILDVLYNGAGWAGRSFVQRRILSTVGISPKGSAGIKGSIEPTGLLEAVRVILDSISPNWTRIDDLESSIKNFLSRSVENVDDATVSVRSAITGEGGIKTFTSKTGHQPVTPAHQKAVVNEAFEAIFNERVIRGLVQAAHDNAANAVIRTADTVRELSATTMSNIIDILHSPHASIGDAVKVLDDIDGGVRAAAVKSPMHVSEDAAKSAAQVVKEELPEVARQSDIAAASHIKKAAGNTDKAAVASSNLARQKQAVAQAMEEVPPELIGDAGHMADVALQAGLQARMMPFVSKMSQFFVSHYQNATLSSAISRGESIFRNMQGAWRRDLNYVHHLVRKGKATEADVFLAFKYLQGKNPQLTEAQQEIVARLMPAVENIFETADEKAAGIFGAFFREGHDPVHIVNKMNAAHYGLSPNHRFNIEAATKNGKLDINELANQWKNWKVEDPLDFMARMQTVAGSLQIDMTVATEAFRIGSQLGRISRKPRHGMMKFPDQHLSTIGRYLPPGVFVDKEILSEIRRMDEILTSVENFKGGFGQFVNRYLDPIMAAWKSGVTVWNPGHHVRNFIGDSALSFLADGVKNPRYYRVAAKAGLWRDKYSAQDALASLRGLGRGAEPGGPVVGKTRNGHQITEKELFYGMMDRGALPSSAVAEDLLETMASPNIARVQQKMAIFGGKGKRATGRVSEARDDTVRLAHALHIIEHGSYKSIDDALDAATKQVRKWHPDGLSLSPKERQIMRRLFPFYSWTRKTLPLVIESMVLHPGRVLVYPKASYNFAQAQGLDLNSMSDPFPPDQLFPSYMNNNVFGPQWQDNEGDYHGINPGIPTVDLLNDFMPDFTNAQSGSDVLKELFGGPIGMLSPLIKAPIESVTGTNAGTGAKVHDLGEYFDSQIPGVNKVSSITGYSPLGTLFNQLPGGEAGLDPRRNVEKGNRDPGFSIEAFLNYLLGSGSMDMSTPSAQTQAEIELRNRLKSQIEAEYRRLG